MLELLLFSAGSWVFWTVSILISLFVIGLLDDHDETSKWLVLMFLLIGGIAGLNMFVASISFKAILAYVGIYLASGIIWSLFKWWLRGKKYSNELNVLSTQVAQQKNSMEHNAASEFRHKVNKVRRALTASENKGRITAWICFWPWSLLKTCTFNLFDNLFEVLRGVYSYMTKDTLKAADTLYEDLGSSLQRR
jgi:hypothetical protein